MEIVSIGGPTPKNTLDAPIEHLLACHRRIEQKLDTLLRALDKPGDEADGAIARVIHFFDTNGLLHTQDEEESIFPRLARRVSASETALLDALHADHELVEALYARVAGGDRTPDTVKQLVDRYHAHIAREDSELVAVMRRHLDDADLRAISQEMKQRRGL